MATSNKSNKSNKSNTSNKSNKSGAEEDELATLGDGSSITLSSALQSAMLALNGKPEAVTAEALQRPSPDTLFRRINDRHRMHLILRDMLAGITVEPGPADTEHLRKVTLGAKGKPQLWLQLDTGPATVPFWQKQVDQVIAQKWHRDDRLAEIVLQQTDILSFLALAVPTPPEQRRWILVLLEAVQEAAFRIAAEIKAEFQMNRPDVLSPDIAPVIQTPAHGAFPSGHATEAFAAATVLGALYPARLGHLRRLAARIAVNRGFAGVHFPVDHLAGAILGDMLGHLVIERVFGQGMLADSTLLPVTTEVGQSLTVGSPGAPNPAWTDVETYAETMGVLHKRAEPVCSPASLGAAASPNLGRLARLVGADVLGGGGP